MSEHYTSKSGKLFSDKKWLENHHAIKSRLRSELVHKLPIFDGDKVLDIGCGTGDWSLLVADKVGHKGKVIGIDIDEESIELANRKKNNHYHRSQVIFLVKKLSELEVVNKFDVIVIFNCLSYISDPSSLLIESLKHIKPGGRIIIKDSDLASDFFWPVDRCLYNKIMSKIDCSYKAGELSYNHFFAREIPFLLKTNGFLKVNSMVQSFSFTHPLDAPQKKYIKENAALISKYSYKLGLIEESIEWAEQFNEESCSCILESERFLYSMSEFVFYALAPSKS